jgi:CheY-like chemotaxis protein
MAVILLVEDERGVLDLISAVLRMAGHEVITASNGLEGLAVFQSYPRLIDLIITDLNMPVMDGYELIGRIREATPDSKIISMSGFSEEEAPKGTKFLRKPFVPDEIRNLVTETLGAVSGAGP